jgi:hypothetical protein
MIRHRAVGQNELVARAVRLERQSGRVLLITLAEVVRFQGGIPSCLQMVRLQTQSGKCY